MAVIMCPNTRPQIGTAMSIGMLGSGAGALVWVNFISKIIAGSGWRTAYLAMAGVNALMIPIALILLRQFSPQR